MPSPSAEHEFARFRRDGDPAALASVFEALAPGLLCVAAQLAPGEAEDLVQATFVTAIERRERYDPSRPLRPWLIGILVHETKALRRRARRAPDPDRLVGPRTSPSAADTAALAELARQASDAIDALPDTFRQVCILRLVHGLEPVQIAHALGIPAATVRSRLHRALERIRGELPTVVAGTLAVVFGSSNLAAMREAVVRSAADAVARPAVTAGGTAALLTVTGFMTHKIVALALLAGLSVGLFALLDESAPEPTPTAAAGSATNVASTSADLADARPEAVGTDGAPRADVTSTAARPRSPFASGRVLGATQEGELAPLADVVVTAFVRAERAGPAVSLGATRTDESGSFTLRTEAWDELPEAVRRTARPYVHAAHDDWVPASELWSEAPITIEMARYRGRVSGRCVDENGRPVSGIDLVLTRAEGAPRDFAQTTDDGTFTIYVPGPGDYQLLAHAQSGLSAHRALAMGEREHRQLGDVPLRVPNASEAIDLAFVLPDGSPIRDIDVVLARSDGRAAAWKSVEFAPPTADRESGVLPRSAARGTTDSDGRVRIGGLLPGGYDLATWIDGDYLDLGTFETSRGAFERRVVVPAQRVTVRAVDSEGQPAVGATITAWHWNDFDTRTLAPRQSWPRPTMTVSAGSRSGRYEFLTLPGASWLFGANRDGAIPAEAAHFAEPGIVRAERVLEILDAESALSASLTLEVVDASGRSIYPVEAALRLPKSGSYVSADWSNPGPEPATWTVPAGDWILRVRAGDHVLHYRYVPDIERPIAFTPNSSTTLRLEAERPFGLCRVILLRPDRGEPPEVRVETILAHTASGQMDVSHRARWITESGRYTEVGVPLGRPFVLPPMPAGITTLDVEATGCEPTSIRVRLSAGEITDVSAQLERVR